MASRDDDRTRQGTNAETPGVAPAAPARPGGSRSQPKTTPRALPRTTRAMARAGVTVQRRAAPAPATTRDGIQDRASDGVSGDGGALPHADRIQDAFGGFDVSSIEAHVGGQAGAAASAIGAGAYATGESVAFQDAPDLHTAAHEAAHVVQQRQGIRVDGGVGRAGDRHEQHADAVADAVVDGRSAEGLLASHAEGTGQAEASVQLKPDSVVSTDYVQTRYANIHKEVWQAARRIGVVRNAPYGDAVYSKTFEDTFFASIQQRTTAGMIVDSLQRFVAPESIHAMIDRSRGRDWDVSDEDNPRMKSTGPNSDTYVTPVAVEIANALARRYVEAIGRLFPQFLRTYIDTEGFKRATGITGPLPIKEQQLIPTHPTDTAVIEALCAAQDQMPLAELARSRPDLQKEIDDKYATQQPMPGGGHGYAVDAPRMRPTKLRFRTEDGLFHWVEALPEGDDQGPRTAVEVAAALFDGPNYSVVHKGRATEEAHRLIPVPPLWGFRGRDMTLFHKQHKDELFARWARTSRDVEWPLDVAVGIGAMVAILPPEQPDPIAELSGGGPGPALDHARTTADPALVTGKDEASVASRLKENLTLLDATDRAFEVVGAGANEIATATGRLTGRYQDATSTTECMANIDAAFALADGQGGVLGTIASGASEIALQYARYGGDTMDPTIRALLQDCNTPFVDAIVALDFPEVARARAALGAQRLQTFDISVQEASLHHSMPSVDNALNADPDPQFNAADAKVKSDELAMDLGTLRLQLLDDPAKARQGVAAKGKEVGDLTFDISLGDKLLRLEQLWEAIDDEHDFWEGLGDGLRGQALQAQSKALRKKFLTTVKAPWDAAKKANDDDGKKQARANFQTLLEEFRPFAREVSEHLKDVARHKKWTKIIVGIAIAIAAFALGQVQFAGILAAGGGLLEASIAGGIVATTSGMVLDKLILGHNPTVGTLITGFVGNIAMFGVIGKLGMTARAAGVSAEIAEGTVGAARAANVGGGAATSGGGVVARGARAAHAFTVDALWDQAIGLVQSEVAMLIDEGRPLTQDEIWNTMEMGVVSVIGMRVGQYGFDRSVDAFKGARMAREVDVNALIAERAELHALGSQLHQAAGGEGRLARGKPPRAAAMELMKRWQGYFEHEARVASQLIELSNKHPRAFKAKAAELAKLREGAATRESLAQQFRSARALLGVEEVGPNLYRGDPDAMDAILAQHKDAGNVLTNVVTDPHTGQRTLTIKTTEGESITLIEKLADAGARKDPAVSVGSARYFEEWLAGIDTSTPDAARVKQRLLEYYARDPEAALHLAAERYGFTPGSLPETQLLVRPDASADGTGTARPERSEGSRAYDQYAYQREGEPRVSRRTDDEVMSRADFEAMYKAGYSYDPVAGRWLGNATPAGGLTPVPGEATTAVLGAVPSEAVGHQLMRKLVAGEAEALRVVGIEPPPGFDPRRSEWALGRKGDQVVLIRGGKGEVRWSDIPGVVDIAHSHPLFDPVTGQPRLLQGRDGSGTIDVRDMFATAKEADLRYFLPSTGDLGFVGLFNKGHRLHTPYVHLGDGKVGNPTSAGMMADTVEIFISDARPHALMEINDTVVWRADIQVWAGDQRLTTTTIYQGFLDLGSFRGDMPSVVPDARWKPIPADHPVLKATSPSATPMATGLDLGHVESSTAALLHKAWGMDPSDPSVAALLKGLSKNDAEALTWLAMEGTGGRATTGFQAWIARLQDPAQRASAMSEARLARRELDADPGASVSFDSGGNARFQSTRRTDVPADAIEAARSVSGQADKKLDQFSFGSPADKQAAIERVKSQAQHEGERAYVEAIAAGDSPKVARKKATNAVNKAIIRLKDVEGDLAARAAAADAIKDGTVFNPSVMDAATSARLADYNSAAPTSGVQARKLAGQLPNMREADFLTFMAGEVSSGGATRSQAQIPVPPGPFSSPTQTMLRWEYADGTVVRYKPLGDAQRPGTPTFTIEVKKNPALPDTGSDDAAFKVGAGGNAVPRSAYDMQNPMSNPDQRRSFETAAMDAVHFELVR